MLVYGPVHWVTPTFEALQNELALTLCIEAGKPIKNSRRTVIRLIDTFRIASEEAVRIEGEILKLEILHAPRAIVVWPSGCPLAPALSAVEVGGAPYL